MNIKFKSFSMLLAMAAALSMTACKEENLAGGQVNPEVDGKYVYVTAALALPTAAGTRSQTDEEGDTNSNAKPDYEYGYDYENDVRSMLLVIADKQDNYITHTVVKGITQAPTTNNKFDFIVNGEIKHDALDEAYKTVLADDKTVNVYVYCNFTARLLNLFNDPEQYEETYDNWLNWSGSVEEAASPAGQKPSISNTIWANRSFLMTNAEKFPVLFPDTIEDWSDYADKSNPYQMNPDGTQGDVKDLEPIHVERAAARIDFRDGSAGDNTYPLEINLDDDAEGETKNLFSVHLTRMSLVNMSKNFHYLRRVSANGLAEGAVIGGIEKKDNYVVDTDADAKLKVEGINPGNAADYFNFPLYSKEAVDGKFAYNMSAWYVDDIDTVLEGSEDTWGGANTYHIWRYVTENTIPSIDQQKTVQSVGVIFKGAIIAGKDVTAGYNGTEPGDEDYEPYVSTEVQDALAAAAKQDANYDYPILYSYDNMLWAGVSGLVKGAILEGEGSPLYFAVEKTLSNWYLVYTEPKEEGEEIKGEFKYSETKPEAKEGEKVQSLTIAIFNAIENGTDDESKKFENCTIGAYKVDGDEDAEARFMAIAPTNGITVYKATDEKDGWGMGYYCYYFYWNRHNDNLKSGEMGIMEFATVRNNVYKLAVTKIGQLGHPRVPGFDPDPVDPEDPDEEPVNYIQVKVEVLPWVVRENNIEF